MKNIRIIILAMLALILGGLVWYSKTVRAPKEDNLVQSSVQKPLGDVVVTAPVENQTIASPVQISGKAKGSWFFEGSFPVKLLDADGKTLAEGTVKALGDWQTEDYVNFIGSLVFKAPTSTQGLLKFSNDNPSGLPENEKSFFSPVKFDPKNSQQSGATCTPNTAECQGNPVLCMEQGKNTACN